MPSAISKQVRIGLHKATFHGISDDDPYFQNAVHDHMEPEFQIISNTLIPDDGVCIDIGANIGIKTFVMAKQTKNGVVLAIEGAPNVYEALQLNISNNKLSNVLAVNAAVTDTTTTVRFVDHSAWGHLATEYDTSQITYVPGMMLGDLIEKHLSRSVSFIKIDTEGHEYTILKNAAPILQQYTPWIYFEFNSFCLLALGNTNPKELLAWMLKNFKYVFRIEKNAVNNGRALLRRFEAKDVMFLLHENIIYNGSVDDFLVTNRESALQDVQHLLLPDPHKQVTEQCQQTQAAMHIKLNTINYSCSRRLIAPLRRLSGMLRHILQ